MLAILIIDRFDIVHLQQGEVEMVDEYYWFCVQMARNPDDAKFRRSQSRLGYAVVENRTGATHLTCIAQWFAEALR